MLPVLKFDFASPLRIGIMVNSFNTQAWVARIVNDIQRSSFAQIVLVVQNAIPSVARKKPLKDRLKTYWTHSLFERYRHWDRQRNQAEMDAFGETDLTTSLSGIPVLDSTPIQKGFVDRFKPVEIARIREANLDVLFRFGFRIIRGEILSCAKHGVWSFHHGDNREYRGAPPGFWEIYEGNPVTGSILQVLTDSLDGGGVIYRSLSATNPDSLYSSLNPMYWKTAEFAMRRLHDLHRHGWSYLESLEEFKEPDNYKKGIYRTPATPVMAQFLARQVGRRIYRRTRSLFLSEQTQWFIACRARTSSLTALTDQTNFKSILPPRGRFYADPFLFKRNEKTFVFFENFDFSKNRAAISFAELQKDGRLGRVRTAIEKDYHLSYPFLFEYNGHVYIMPESRGHKTIELYRAIDFPQDWVFVRNIAANVLAVDPTIFQQEGKLWLLANIAVPGASTFDELHLFHSNTLEGDWTPHPKNPVVSDVRRSRPAGALFFESGKLIRPSQDCSLRYGGAMTFNEVQVLSETEYREIPFARIEPHWFPRSLCTHTYNRTAEFEVLDGMVIKRHLRFLNSQQT